MSSNEPITTGHVVDAPNREDQMSVNNPGTTDTNVEHPQIVKTMEPRFDRTQAEQAPEGTIQSGVFTAEGERKPARNDPTAPDTSTSATSKTKLG